MVLLAFTCPGQLEHWGYVFSFPSGRTVTLFRERSTSLRIPPPILIISTDCSHTRRATTPRSRWPLPALGSVPAASETLGLRAFLPEGKHFQEPPSGARVPPPSQHGRSRIVPAPPRPWRRVRGAGGAARAHCGLPALRCGGSRRDQVGKVGAAALPRAGEGQGEGEGERESSSRAGAVVSLRPGGCPAGSLPPCVRRSRIAPAARERSPCVP